ncbi:MAG TPA: anti-sigma factor [Vicinamibacterales bacterium]|nr:anti-sigma factor [Vicinamibacterales bacterium]
MTHDELRDSLPAFALGTLDADERQAVVAHLATCEACAAELAELERLVMGIGLDAAPVTPPPGLKARVMNRVAREQQTPAPAPAPVPFVPSQPRHDRPASSSSMMRLALAASALVAIAASFYAQSLRSEIRALRETVAAGSAEANSLRTEVLTLRKNWADVTRAMNVLKAPDMLKVDLKGQETMPGAAGRAFWSRTAGLMFTADGLPALRAGQVYQLWTITGTTATGAGTFTPDAQGAASVSAVVAPGAATPDAFGVTIEPTGGSATPTQPIVMVGSGK